MLAFSSRTGIRKIVKKSLIFLGLIFQKIDFFFNQFSWLTFLVKKCRLFCLFVKIQTQIRILPKYPFFVKNADENIFDILENQNCSKFARGSNSTYSTIWGEQFAEKAWNSLFSGKILEQFFDVPQIDILAQSFLLSRRLSLTKYFSRIYFTQIWKKGFRST